MYSLQFILFNNVFFAIYLINNTNVIVWLLRLFWIK